jgi:hypothetical protein
MPRYWYERGFGALPALADVSYDGRSRARAATSRQGSACHTSAEMHGLWFPEVRVQAEARFGTVRPYLGAGGGPAVESLLGERGTDPTLSAAGGARIDLPGSWGLEGELRIRAIDPWTGTTADWGFSVIRRL